jgi:hypothetical protein
MLPREIIRGSGRGPEAFTCNREGADHRNKLRPARQTRRLLWRKAPQLRTFRHLMAAHREKCGDTAPRLQNHASSSDTIEEMAAHICSDRILRSGDSFGYPLVDASNFPSPRIAAVRALYRDTGALGSGGGLDLRQTLA